MSRVKKKENNQVRAYFWLTKLVAPLTNRQIGISMFSLLSTLPC